MKTLAIGLRVRGAALCTLLLLVLILTGCGPGYQNYGVLLWGGPDATIADGSLVGILSSSEIRNVFAVVAADEEEAVPTEFDRWRVRVFGSRTEAETFAEEYAQFKGVLGKSTSQGLPIRISDDNLSTMIYRLRRDEIVKVLYRQEEETNLSGLVDYWYQVLTETGVTGWVFGYNLDVAALDDAENLQETVQANDELLSGLFTSQWKPEYYLPMIRDSQYDLSRFTPGYGLFADQNAKTIRISVPEESRSFSYSELFNPRYGQYLADGTSLQITIHNTERLTVQYETIDRVVSRTFVRITESIPELIRAELDRRELLYRSILEVGTEFSSNIYGSIRFAEERQGFVWQGYGSLDPSLRPQGFSGTGTLVFDRYLNRELAAEYTGVVSMVPEQGESWQRVSWLYTLTPTGIRFEFLDFGEPATLAVASRALSPFIIFFEAETQAEDDDAAASG